MNKKQKKNLYRIIAALVLVLILKAALSQPPDASIKEAPRAHRYIRKQKRPPAAGV